MSQAGFITSNEIIKYASQHGRLIPNLSSLLTFTTGATYHKFYTGPVRVRRIQPLIITDIAFPRDLFCDEQLGRRFVHVHLQHKVAWQTTAKAGTGRWRTLCQENADAANAIVSWVIDEFFAAEQPMVFQEIAEVLGFELLNKGGDLGIDPKADLLALFAGCCRESVSLPKKGSKFDGPGWKLIQREHQTELANAWRAVCDDLNDGFTSSRRVKEVDWGQLLGVSGAVECDVMPNGGSTVAIRFRMGKLRGKNTCFNEQIELARQKLSAPQSDLLESPPLSSNLPDSPAPAGLSGLESPEAQAQHSAPAVPAFNLASITDDPTSLPVLIDLETRSACDLAQEGGRRYAEHSSTEILSAVALIDGRLVVWTPPLDQPLNPGDLAQNHGLSIETFAGPAVPQPLLEAIQVGRPFCAHNALGFERPVWAAKIGQSPATWLDTLPLARAASLPGKLDEIGERLFSAGKDKDGQALMKRLCSPQPDGHFVPFNRSNALGLVRYNITDVLLLAQLYMLVKDAGEPEIIRLDQRINERGVAFDSGLANSLVQLSHRHVQAAGLEVEKLTNGELQASDLQRTAFLLRWLNDRGAGLSDLTKNSVDRVLERPTLDPVVTGVLRARRVVTSKAESKLDAGINLVDDDNRLRHQLVYHKAHTGRWSGRGVQPHNLPRPHKDIKDIDALIAAADDYAKFRLALPATVTFEDGINALVRSCFRAEPGKMLIIADYASIEARGVAWCAGETKLLDSFSRGEDVYCQLASQIFGRPITRKEERERAIGKEAVLGCGYNMGQTTFATQVAARGIDLAEARTSAESVVEGYRDAYPTIAGVRIGEQPWRTGGLWKDVEAAARKAVEHGTSSHAGRCLFLRDGTSLVIKLPSSRKLTYRNARLEEVNERGSSKRILFDGPEKHKANTTTYGGKLVENTVQAICRDLLANAIVQCEREGWPVVLHVHDEIVLEVPADQADEALKRLVVIMSTPPEWAQGFPIQVEGYVADLYRKSPAPGASHCTARNGVVLT